MSMRGIEGSRPQQEVSNIQSNRTIDSIKKPFNKLMELARGIFSSFKSSPAAPATVLKGPTGQSQLEKPPPQHEQTLMQLNIQAALNTPKTKMGKPRAENVQNQPGVPNAPRVKGERISMQQPEPKERVVSTPEKIDTALIKKIALNPASFALRHEIFVDQSEIMEFLYPQTDLLGAVPLPPESQSAEETFAEAPPAPPPPSSGTTFAEAPPAPPPPLSRTTFAEAPLAPPPPSSGTTFAEAPGAPPPPPPPSSNTAAAAPRAPKQPATKPEVSQEPSSLGVGNFAFDKGVLERAAKNTSEEDSTVVADDDEWGVDDKYNDYEEVIPSKAKEKVEETTTKKTVQTAKEESSKASPAVPEQPPENNMETLRKAMETRRNRMRYNDDNEE